MFAPALGMSGRPVAAVVHRSGSATTPFLDTIASWGGRVVELTADEHDRRCAAMQTLTHAAVLAFGLAVGDLTDTDDSTPMSTPPHTVLLALLARISGGTPAVYHDIQTANPYSAQARKALASALADLSAAVETGDPDDFAALMSRARRPLGDRADEYALLCERLIGTIQ